MMADVGSPLKGTRRLVDVFKPENRKFLVGVLLLLVVVLEWTGGNFLTQGIFKDGYDKAFWVTYSNTSAFSFYLLPLLVRWVRSSSSTRQARTPYEPLSTADHDDDDNTSEITTPRLGQYPPRHLEAPPLTTQETIKLAFAFCILWFIANWTVNASLMFTSVASSTILCTMSGFFTLAAGLSFGIETFSLRKLGAVVVSFLGVLVVTTSDGVSPAQVDVPPISTDELRSPTDHTLSHPLLGNFLALLSALFYAFYVTLLKVKVGDESRIDMSLFFGFVGLFNVLLLWPVGIVLHLLNIERFELPSSTNVWIVIAVNMLITLSSDYIYVVAMLKTTPLVVTVGISLTIPVALFGDWALYSIVPTLKALLGASLVVLGFLALGTEKSKDSSKAQPAPT